MIWRWLICSSVGLGVAVGALVTGDVELTNSKNLAVRKHKDYAGVVLWLEPVDRPVPAMPPKHVEMLQRDKLFQPHVVAISLGGTVDLPNLDLIFHNAFSNFSGQPFDIGLYAPRTSKGVTFKHAGIVRVFCNIHATMSAIIAVLNTPWYAVTQATGKYAIAGVPAGRIPAAHFSRARAAGESEVSGAPHHGAGKRTDDAADLDFRDRLHSRAASQQVRQGLSAGGQRRHLSGSAQAMRLRFCAPVPADQDHALHLGGDHGVVCDRGADCAAQYHQEHVGQPGSGGTGQLSRLRFAVGRAHRLLNSVSRLMASMSDVRAAFGTRDQATIRDSASELWSRISTSAGLFLVTDPRGKVIASLGGVTSPSLRKDLDLVQSAEARFPQQSSGFFLEAGELYHLSVTPVYVQPGGGQDLLNVLVAGERVDAIVAQRLKAATNSEFLFLAPSGVIASTLNPRATTAVVADLARKTGSQKVSDGVVEYARFETPLTDIMGRPVGKICILRSFEGAQRRIASLYTNIILLWLGAMTVGFVLTYLLARRIVEPVEQLDRAAAEVARQNYAIEVPVAAKTNWDGWRARSTRCARASGRRARI